MRTAPDHRRAVPAAEQGFMLLAVVVMMAVLLITLAIAAPVVTRELRRDKEVESMHRAQQYVRAIRLYQRKFPKQYPGSMDALEKSNNIRFLRKKYIDPLTGQADWRVIHVGENKTSVKGFFGQPLSGLNTTGIGSGLGTASQLGTGFGGATSPTAGATTKVGATSGLAAGFSGATVATPGTAGATAATDTSGAAAGSTGTSPIGAGGGGLIMGVGSSRTGESILNPGQQTTYETWEFLYDPRIEQMYAKGAANSGVGSQSAGSFGKDAVSGQPNSGGTPATPAGTTPSPTPPATPAPTPPQ